MTSRPPEPLPRVSPKHYRGLGDLIEAVTGPIGASLTRITGVRLPHCGGCRRRRDKLNKLFPLRRQDG